MSDPTTTPPLVCRICNNATGNESFVAEEMMFGTKDEFDYFQCSICGCVQIANCPADMSKYYPGNYYAFGADSLAKENWFKRYLRRSRAAYALSGRNIVGKAVSRLAEVPRIYRLFGEAGIGFQSRILEVGCGNGELLRYLSRDGFLNLTGSDPFLKLDVDSPSVVTFLRHTVDEINGEFDVILLIHSLEHMPDPLRVFANLSRLLASNGWVIVELPVASSWAWRNYRQHWAQIDAPRHFFLHTVASLAILCERTGLSISRVRHISDAFQFWGSEQYLRGVSLYDKESYRVNRNTTLFTSELISRYELLSARLNHLGEGDTAVFLIHKPAVQYG